MLETYATKVRASCSPASAKTAANSSSTSERSFAAGSRISWQLCLRQSATVKSGTIQLLQAAATARIKEHIIANEASFITVVVAGRQRGASTSDSSSD